MKISMNEYSASGIKSDPISVGDIVYYEGYMSNGVLFADGIGTVSYIHRHVDNSIIFRISPSVITEHQGEVFVGSDSYPNDFIVKLGNKR